MPRDDAANFDDSVRGALEAAGAHAAKGSSSTSTPSSLARSPAFFEALCLLCRHAPPVEVVRAAAKGKDEEDEGDVEEEEKPQRLLLGALAAARALRGAAPLGYGARVLQEAAKAFSSALSDELAEALAASLLLADKEEEEEDDGGDGDRGGDRDRASPSSPLRPPLQLQAFFFGLEDESPGGNRPPTLSSTLAFPVAVSSSPDLLSGSTGRALWPASRALSSVLLSRGSELVRGREVTELGCGVGMAGAALLVGARWWQRRQRRGSEEERGGGGREPGGSSAAFSSFSFSPRSLRLTDGDAESVANARRTLEANGIEVEAGETRKVSVRVLDWLEEESSADGEITTNNFVVGSDIMYDPESAQALSRVLSSLLSPPPAGEKNRDPRRGKEQPGATESSSVGAEAKTKTAREELSSSAPPPPLPTFDEQQQQQHRLSSSSSPSSSALLAGVVRSEETAAAFERAFAAAGLSFERSSSGDDAPPGSASSPSPSPSLLPRVRAWHSGDEGVEVRWWRLWRGEN